MNKSKIIESFNKISKSESITAAYTFLFKNSDLSKLVRIGISKDIELFKNKEFGNFLIGNNECLVKILSSEIWDEFLFWFVQSKEMQTVDFFSMIVQVDAKKFITAIRFTQGFLNENVSSVLEKLDFSNEFSEHENIWRKLRNDDIESWSKIKSDSNTWSDISAEDFFSNLINWLEIERFADDSNGRLDMLSRAYNFIISLYLSENYEASKSITHDKLDESFWRSFEKLNISLTDTFSSILEYVWFQEAVIIPYSYDLNIEPVLKNGTLDFSFQSEEVFSDWKKDGLRYNLNQIRYKELGMKISSYLIHEKGIEIPKGKTDKDQENNLMLFINSRATDALLSDLHLDEMKIKGKVYNTHSIVQPILAYSYNRKLRYEDELQQLRPVSNSWQWSYYQLNELSRKKDVDCYPFFLMSKEEYIMHNVQANHSEQKNVYQELIDLFGYRITERFKFNRHRLGYDVWQTPFVRLGEMIFCPMMFFATNEWFYSIAQIVIKNYDRNGELRKPSSLGMEKKLLERFKGVNLKWKCLMPDFKHEGDIDMIISDGNSDLLIQLKRTYFRTGLKDAYFETIRSDRKAISQLIQGEKYILDNKLYPLQKSKYKWLVSTSFENVNQVFKECRKVNYLDLIWVLKNKQLDTIDELIEYVRNDKILDEMPLK